jgi:signal transduction histidine kinase
MNLILNGAEAMASASDPPREIFVRTTSAGAEGVLVAVEDRGPGLDPQAAHRVFDTFFTTKSDGMGMGLSIARSIIEAHGGRLWTSPAQPHGAVFQFIVPSARRASP